MSLPPDDQLILAQVTAASEQAWFRAALLAVPSPPCLCLPPGGRAEQGRQENMAQHSTVPPGVSYSVPCGYFKYFYLMFLKESKDSPFCGK